MEIGKTVLITGGTNGIGMATANQLSCIGYMVTIVGRTQEKCKKVAESIQENSGNLVRWIDSDLSTLDGIRRTASVFKQNNADLHVLLNNAGAIFSERLMTIDGYEKTFALNHLNYFYLTHLLMDLIQESQPARIINVSSMAHVSVKRIDLNNLQGEKYYSGWEAYSKSKLFNLLFTYELSKQLSDKKISVNALHPGYVGTNFGMNNGLIFKVFTSLGAKLLARKPVHGAQTCIYLSTSKNVEGISGKYFFDCREIRSSKFSYDEKIRTKIWQLSTEIIST